MSNAAERYRQITKAWEQLRNSGNVGVDNMPVQEFLYMLRQYVERYINNPTSVTALTNIEKILSDAKDIIESTGPSSEGLDLFLPELFRRVYEDFYNEYLRDTGITAAQAGKQRRSRNDSRRMTAIRDVIVLPTTLIGDSQWSKLIQSIGGSGKKEFAPRAIRPSLRGSDAPSFSTTNDDDDEDGDDDIAMEKSAAKKAKQEQQKREEDEDRERKQTEYDFEPIENMNKSRYKQTDLSWILDELTEKKGDSRRWTVAEMIAHQFSGQRRRENREIPMEDFWLVKNEVRFWIEEFFNSTLRPCNFATPSTLMNADQYEKFQTRIMYSLLKLTRAVADMTGKLTPQTALFTPAQWREYLSINFPAEAAVYFQERSDATIGNSNNVHEKVMSVLSNIEHTFVAPQ